MKTNEIIKALRQCANNSCEGCPLNDLRNSECIGEMAAAADEIEKLTDRCARYAEEIMVLQERQKEEAPMKIRKTITSEIEWSTTRKAQADGKLHELLQLGDELDITLKTGEELTAQVTDTEDGHIKLMLKNCMKDECSMNEEATNKGGWRGSGMRLWLNETVFHMLPDELQEIIAPRRIVQTVNGETLESEDKLWLPSFTELFGEEKAKDWAPSDTGETQMELFTTERSRVKEVPGEGTWWYWLRSPYGSNSTYFCGVNGSGAAAYSYASVVSGVAFGFCLENKPLPAPPEVE